MPLPTHKETLRLEFSVLPLTSLYDKTPPKPWKEKVFYNYGGSDNL